MEMAPIEIVGIIIATLFLFEVIRSHLDQSHALRFNKDSINDNVLQEFPSVSVIRPIKGLDFGAEENAKAALNHGYPGEIEVIFVFDDENEPGVPAVKAALEEFPDVNARIIYCGQPKTGWTGKLNAMLVASQEAVGDIIAFADSDIRSDENTLRSLVESLLSNDNSGAAFAPVVAQIRPETIGDAGYNILLNGLYSPALAKVAKKSGNKLSFVMGQYMIFRRQSLDAIGGIESAEGQLVDDMFLGARISNAGYDNMVSARPVSIIQSNLSFSQFWSIFKRWIAFSRSGLSNHDLKLISWIRGILFWVSFVGAILSPSMIVAMIFAISNLLLNASIIRLDSIVRGRSMKLWHWPMVPFLFLSAPIIYLSIFLGREVNWRGRNYSLDGDAKLSQKNRQGME
ncbi:MAG: glycosyltransferase [Candidatus Thermoplasmatota archaeon]|nr:glycosyltransferase [Candidatus Thermoplasmatota archaeon]